MLGQLLGGWSIVRQALAAQRRIDAGDGDSRLTDKLVTADFYCQQLLPFAAAQEAAVLGGVDVLAAIDADNF